MPRARGFRDPRTVVLYRQKPRQLTRLLHDDTQRITTSRLSAQSIERVLSCSLDAQPRHTSSRTTRGKVKSPYDGYIAAVKDNFVTSQLPSTCASNILEGFSAKDATVVSLLKEAGVAVVAKTNMDEFGMGSHSVHSAYGAVQNGRGSEALSAGGSSGGSALAVASGLVDCAIGSDTGGSVRLPAAYTGIVGFKPSYGLISRHGLVPYANSLDTVGLFGRTCLDVFLLNKLLAQYDSEDPTSLTPETRQRIEQAREARTGRTSSIRPTIQDAIPSRPTARLEQPRKEWLPFHQQAHSRRIGVPLEYNIQEMHPSVRWAWMRALTRLQYFGHEIVPVSLPSTQQALSAYYVLAPAEASSNLAKYDGVRYGKLRDADFKDDLNGPLYSEYRGTHFGEEVKRRILLGSFTLSAGAIDNYFVQAQKVRRIVQSDFNLVFKMPHPLLPDTKVNPDGVDYIVCPTAPTPPPTLDEVKSAGPLDSYINDVFTVPASLAGLPALSLPAEHHPRVPAGYDRAVGIQVIGQFGDDYGVLNFSRRYLERGVGRDKNQPSVGARPKLK